MLHFPKNIFNFLILFKQWPKIFKCGPIDVMSVVMVMVVKKFFLKNTCFSDVIQCIHDEMLSCIQDMQRAKIWVSLISLKSISNCLLGSQGFIMASSILGISVQLCEVIHQEFHRLRSFQTHDFEFVALVYIDQECFCQMLYVEHNQYLWRRHADFLEFFISHNDVCILLQWPWYYLYQGGGTSPGFAGSCHGLGSECTLISGLINILVHPSMVDWVDGIIARYVLIISSNLRKL